MLELFPGLPYGTVFNTSQNTVNQEWHLTAWSIFWKTWKLYLGYFSIIILTSSKFYRFGFFGETEYIFEQEDSSKKSHRKTLKLSGETRSDIMPKQLFNF